MLNFEVYKENAEERLSYTSSDTPRSFIRALEDIVKLCKYGQKLEAENQTLQKHVQKLEQQREWLINELCISSLCDFPSQIECKYRSERGYYCPEQKEKFKCWVAHAEQAIKE